MAKITFLSHLGASHTVEADDGLSVMEAARRNGVPGIDADCGGNCACGTCHVYVDEIWMARVGSPGLCEQALLEFVHQPRSTSRLSCQITVHAELDGLLLTLPEQQGI
jgi:2Fe-2S ferredoxin